MFSHHPVHMQLSTGWTVWGKAELCLSCPKGPSQLCIRTAAALCIHLATTGIFPPCLLRKGLSLLS